MQQEKGVPVLYDNCKIPDIHIAINKHVTELYPIFYEYTFSASSDDALFITLI